MANRYWVGGTASWDGTAGSKWALTSGGGGGQAVPTSSDDVFFDANSGAGTTTVATTDAICNDLTFTGYTGTFTATSGGAGGPGVQVFGSLTLVSGMTYSNGNVTTKPPFTFKATSTGKTITSASKTITRVTFDGVGGGWTLQDNLTLSTATATTGALTLTNGALDFNNKNVTSASFSSNNSNTRSLTLGTGTYTIANTSGAVTWWNTATTTGLTFISTGSTIKYNDASGVAGGTFSGGGLTFNNLWLNTGASTNSLTIVGSNTFNEFKDTGTAAHSVLFTSGTTQTVSTFTVSGTVGKLITINSTDTSTHTLSKTTGTVSCDYLNIQHSIATGGATWYAGANSTNNQGVATTGSGWIFTAPPGGVNSGFFAFI